MTRLFTLTLQYEGICCPVLVNFRSKGYDLCFWVHYMNKEVFRLVPGGILAFSLSEGLQRPADLLDPSALELVHYTIDAITEYIKVHQL